MHKVLVNRLGGLSLPRKSVVRLTNRPSMTLDVYRGRKTTKQQQHCPFVHPSNFQFTPKLSIADIRALGLMGVYVSPCTLAFVPHLVFI